MRHAGAALVVGLSALAVYLATLCPTVFVGDSGELAWAATSLGIAHQPGYPLWTLLGRVAVSAGSGSPIWILNATSALFAAAACALATLLLCRMTGRVLVAAGAGLALALSRGVWAVATVTEVYALNLLLVAAVLLAGWRAREGKPRLFLLAAYLLGLGTANHPLVLTVAPAVAWLAWPAISAPRVGAMAVAFALGLSAYLYLPVRWSAGPEMVWGAVGSAGDLWDHVTRAQYGGLGGEAAPWSERAGTFLGILGRSVPLPVLGLAAFGLVTAWRASRAAGGMLLLHFLVAGPALVVAIRFQDSFLDRSVASVFFLPAVLAAFLAAGWGLAELDRLASERVRGQARAGLFFSLVIAVIPPLAMHRKNASSCDRSGSRLGEHYGRAVLSSMPPDARLYSTGDNSTFLLAYLQRVEGLRPDVTVCDRTLNLSVETYGEDFLAMSRSERKARAVGREVELAFALRGTPTFYTDEVDLSAFGECRTVPAGLVNQLLRPGEAPADIAHQPVGLPSFDDEEFLECHLAGVALYREARWLVQEGRTLEARDSLERAAQAASRIAPILRNIGLTHLEIGDLGAAEKRIRQALALEPENVDALYNLGALYAYAGRPEESVEAFDRILAAGVERAEVHLSRGVQLVKVGRLDEAGGAARRALDTEPGLEPARALLAAVERGLEIGGEAGLLEARRAVEPVTTGGTLQLAQRYLERGELERASELYRDAHRKAPESMEAAYGLGYGLLRLGDLPGATRAFRQVLELDSASAPGRNALAYVFALAGDSLPTAERLVVEALELDAGLAAYWNDTLGWIRYRRGDLDGALAALEESMRTLPVDDVSMRAENDYHMGVVLIAVGREGEAREYLSRSAGRATTEPWIPDLHARARQVGLEVGL